jgi:hypothetical protein
MGQEKVTVFFMFRLSKDEIPLKMYKQTDGKSNRQTAGRQASR